MTGANKAPVGEKEAKADPVDNLVTLNHTFASSTKAQEQNFLELGVHQQTTNSVIGHAQQQVLAYYQQPYVASMQPQVQSPFMQHHSSTLQENRAGATFGTQLTHIDNVSTQASYLRPTNSSMQQIKPRSKTAGE